MKDKKESKCQGCDAFYFGKCCVPQCIREQKEPVPA